MTVKLTSDDFGKVGHALGIAYGIAAEYEGGQYASDMSRAAAKYASDVLGEAIDDLALNPTSNLGHVYEWRTPGNKQSRLFDIYSKGNGKSSVVTFVFKASKTPILSIDEQENAGKILPVPNAIKARLKKRRYIFRQKAQFFEYGLQSANLRPLGPNQKIFIPFSRPINGRTYAFVDQATVNFENTKYRGKFQLAFRVLSIEAAGKASTWIERETTSNTNDLQYRMGKTNAKSINLGFSTGQDYARSRMKYSGKLINAKAEEGNRL